MTSENASQDSRPRPEVTRAEETWSCMEARHARERNETIGAMDIRHARERRDAMRAMMADPRMFEFIPASTSSEVGMRADLDEIVASVSSHYGVSIEDIIGPSRTKLVVEARHAAYSIARQAGYSLTDIGRYFKRDHTTIMNGCMRHRQRTGEADGGASRGQHTNGDVDKSTVHPATIKCVSTGGQEVTALSIKNYTKAEGLALEDHYIASAAEMKMAAKRAKEMQALAERKERALAERARLQKKAEMSEPRNRHGRSSKDRRKMMDDAVAMLNKRGEMTAGDIQARLKVNSDEVKSLISSLIYRNEIYIVAKLQGVCIYRARIMSERSGAM